MRAVRTRPLIALSLLLGACWAGDPDIMALLLHLKFEPHHRNFVKNLYDKQMLVSRHPPRSHAIISRRWRHTLADATRGARVWWATRTCRRSA